MLESKFACEFQPVLILTLGGPRKLVTTMYEDEKRDNNTVGPELLYLRLICVYLFSCLLNVFPFA